MNIDDLLFTDPSDDKTKIPPEDSDGLRNPGRDDDKPFEITDNSDIDNPLDRLKEKGDKEKGKKK